MAIEIESGFSVKKSILPLTVFVIGLIAVLFVASSYAFLYFSSEDISRKIDERNQKLIETAEEKALKKELSGYEFKINTFKSLLENRGKTLNVFSFLEQVCHPDVWFKNFNYDSSKSSVSISATTKDFIVLAQQLIILKQHQDILTKITLSNLSRDPKEGVNFSLDLVFAPQIFK